MRGFKLHLIIYLTGITLITQITFAANTEYQNERISSLEKRIAQLEHPSHKTKNSSKSARKPDSNNAFIFSRERYDFVRPYNQDLSALLVRKKMQDNNRLSYPRVELGGSIIGLGTIRNPPFDAPTQSDINLSGANINIASEITKLLFGSIRISYDPNPPFKIDNRTIVTRTTNSNIFLNTAFLTLGDLNRTPFYVTVGQIFMPFGEYNSSLLTATLPARIGRMRQRPLLIGFQQPYTSKGFNASVFIFRGDSFTPGRRSIISNGGANLGYTAATPYFKFHTGASYIANIADSGGMQNNRASSIVTDAGEYVDNEFNEEDDDIVGPLIAFRGFGSNGLLIHDVPAYNGRAKLEFIPIPISFYGELVQPTTAFDPTNLSFNNNGAQPSAWNAEGAVRFKLFNKKSIISLGYGRSSEALSLNLPLYTMGGSFRMKVHKLVTFSLGYQYDVAYSEGDFATGQTLPVNYTVGTTTKTFSAQVKARY